ncbi:DinB family protein [Ancylobacter sp. MQZ15Z-1]|uniref:DinB family protein n=1 Tax=Ancylobacter mangrovi TaxID=2972472 RepID=A0A9X2T0I2_9HYPH|nr:DinB family protein [Ancylobacter mangrovi]MCS0493612.1 DinB family protein [Ancylobacter mangrovi]
MNDLAVGRYRQFAGYNAWANRRLYAAAAALSDEQYRAERGAFFGSVHGTLNHLLVTDRIWMRRITGSGEAPDRLDAILFDTLPELATARHVEDERISAFVDTLSDCVLMADLHYANMSGKPFVQPVAGVLDHLFNHQTHHRGQAHCLISGFLGNAATPSLDLLMFQREAGLAHAEPS